MIDFPRLIKDGDIELVKLAPTFELARRIFQIVNDNRVFFGKWLGWVEFIKSAEDEYPYVQKLSRTDNGSYHIMAGGEIVGNIGFVKFSETDKYAEIGYWLDKAANGRGIMTRSVKLMEKLSFEHCGFNRVEIRVDTENFQSQNVAKRCGFSQDGILRQSMMLHGVPRDIILFSKLNSDCKGK